MAASAMPRPRPGLMPRSQGEHTADSSEAWAHRTAGSGSAMHEHTFPALSDGEGILAKVRSGLPYSVVETLIEALRSQRELSQAVGIPATTLARRKRAGRLTPAESDRTVRIARVVDMSRVLMRGDLEAARRWLTMPHDLLDGESPLQRASTETGARDVEQLVGRLRHGVFG